MKNFAVKIGLLACLFLFPFSQSQAQLPGFQLPLAGDAAIDLALGDQNSSWISSGDAFQLVVWTDNRANPYVYYEYETANDIYAARLDNNGQMVDTVPFVISAGRGGQTNPKAIWNGSHWLVVFESAGLGGTGYYSAKTLVAVRVAADGSVLDEQPTPLYGLTPGPTNSWAVASDGNQWVVAAVGNSISSDIFALRIGPDGSVLGPPNHAVVESSGVTPSSIRLAQADGIFLLTFNESGTTSALRFDSSLTPLDAAAYTLLNNSIHDLESNGSEFFITWNQQLPDFSSVVKGSRVSTTGFLLDGAGIDISTGFPLDATPGGIGVAWDGLNWRVSWPNGGSARVAAVSSSGAVQVAGGTPLPGVTAGLTSGNGVQGIQFTWTAFNYNEYDVYAATADVNDNVLTNSGVSIGAPHQYRTDLAAGTDGYMAVYRSAHATQSRILAQPLDAAGQSLTAEPIQLDIGAAFAGPGSPAVAWNGTLYMVSWGTSAGVVMTRLQQDGSVLDAAPVVVMNPGFGAVDIAASGNNFLIAGFRIGISAHYIVPVAARVSGAGTVLDAVPLTLGGSYARAIAVTGFDGRWLATWHRNVTHDDPIAETRGVFVNADGSLAEQFQAHSYFSTTGGNSIFTIGLASGGGKALLVQSQELSSGVETDLLAHLINADGTVEPMINLTPWVGNQYRPEVSFNGTDFILVYQDQKNRIAAFTLDQLDARGDIYGMRINPDGTVVDPQGFLVSNSPFGETDPVLASRGTDTLIVASQILDESTHASYRIQLSDVLAGTNRFPVAVAGVSARSADVPFIVDFSSAGSIDPEGAGLSYLWQFADGTSSVLANPTHEYTLPGDYPAILTVFDDLGQTGSQGVTVEATAPNQLPVAVATASRYSGPVPLSTILSADGSYDPDGYTGNIEWSSSDGRKYYGSPAYFTFNDAGNYTITLRVYDSRGAYGEDSLLITAGGANQPPTAQASATPSSGQAPLTVAFSSSGSTDPDGSIVSYSWDFGDGSVGSGANPSHLYSSTGTYTAVLTVTDNSGATATSSVTIEVSGVSATALRSAINMATSKKRGITSVNAVVTVTNGIGGIEKSVSVQGKWTLPDGSVFTRYQYTDQKGKATFNTAANLNGVYGFEIITLIKAGFAWDKLASEISDSFTLGGGNQPPVASFSDSCPALSCVFDGSGSSDPDGSIVSYSWNFGDGATGSGVNVSHDYAVAGTYSVSLTVTDGQGATDSTSQAVTVSDTPTPTIVVHVGDLDGGSTAAPRGKWQASVSVLVHDAAETPVEGASISGSWSNGAKGSGSCVTNAAGTCTITKSNIKANSASVRFTVVDVSVANAVFSASDNHDPDGDSDGTSIVIQQ